MFKYFFVCVFFSFFIFAENIKVSLTGQNGAWQNKVLLYKYNPSGADIMVGQSDTRWVNASKDYYFSVTDQNFENIMDRVDIEDVTYRYGESATPYYVVVWSKQYQFQRRGWRFRFVKKYQTQQFYVDTFVKDEQGTYVAYPSSPDVQNPNNVDKFNISDRESIVRSFNNFSRVNGSSQDMLARTHGRAPGTLPEFSRVAFNGSNIEVDNNYLYNNSGEMPSLFAINQTILYFKNQFGEVNMIENSFVPTSNYRFETFYFKWANQEQNQGMEVNNNYVAVRANLRSTSEYIDNNGNDEAIRFLIKAIRFKLPFVNMTAPQVLPSTLSSSIEYDGIDDSFVGYEISKIYSNAHKIETEVQYYNNQVNRFSTTIWLQKDMSGDFTYHPVEDDNREVSGLIGFRDSLFFYVPLEYPNLEDLLSVNNDVEIEVLLVSNLKPRNEWRNYQESDTRYSQPAVEETVKFNMPLSEFLQLKEFFITVKNAD